MIGVSINMARRSIVVESDYDKTIKFNSCDTCVNGIVTKNGVECGKKLALICKPDLLQIPKFYRNWELDE